VALIFDPDIELNSIQYAFPNWDSSQEFPEDGDVGGRRVLLGDRGRQL
jgi:hypothetical protein